MVARNKSELKKMIMDKAALALTQASQQAEQIMKEETRDYYVGSTPKQYIRTYQIPKTPRVTGITKSMNTASFTAYLDTNYTYPTGKNPTMLDVLNLANYRNTNSSVGKLNYTVGRTDFWERAVMRIKEKTADSLRDYFR